MEQALADGIRVYRSAGAVLRRAMNKIATMAELPQRREVLPRLGAFACTRNSIGPRL
jgi:hypothetical protein